MKHPGKDITSLLHTLHKPTEQWRDFEQRSPRFVIRYYGLVEHYGWSGAVIHITEMVQSMLSHAPRKRIENKKVRQSSRCTLGGFTGFKPSRSNKCRACILENLNMQRVWKNARMVDLGNRENTRRYKNLHKDFQGILPILESVILKKQEDYLSLILF